MPSRKSDGRKSHETAAEARPALSSAVEVEPGPAAHSPTLGKKNRDKEVDKDKDRDGKERKDALTIEAGRPQLTPPGHGAGQKLVAPSACAPRCLALARPLPR